MYAAIRFLVIRLHNGLVALVAILLIAPAGSASAADTRSNDVQAGVGAVGASSHPGSKTYAATVVFPLLSDDWDCYWCPILYWSRAGDTVAGNRALSMGTVSHAVVHLVMDENLLNGPGFVNLEFRLNAMTVGAVTLLPGMGLVDTTFNFPPSPVAGSINIRWLETNTVISGGGAIRLNAGGASYINFSVDPTAVKPSSWGAVKSLYY